MASTLPKRASLRSSHSNHITSFSSKMKFKKTSNKNIPPNAAISAWCSISFAEYSFGLLSAMLMTSIMPISAVTATMTIGNTRRIPNTAMSIPTVKKIIFQNLSHVLSTEALTTALSNDSEISITAKISVTNSADIIVPTPPCEKPHHAAIASAIVVKTISK